jgi:asparaginyl-tRNA synthetase
MKQSVDRVGNPICENFDLLMPYKVGELIGGSIREDNLDIMLGVMKDRKISKEPLEFYLDTRRYGTVPHGGFGLGLDRMCMMFTGMDNIKDVVAFPVHFKNCNY